MEPFGALWNCVRPAINCRLLVLAPGAKRTPEAAAENYGYVCGHKTLCRRGIKGIWILKMKPHGGWSVHHHHLHLRVQLLLLFPYWPWHPFCFLCSHEVGYSNCKLQNDRELTLHCFARLTGWICWPLRLRRSPPGFQISDFRLAWHGQHFTQVSTELCHK